MAPATWQELKIWLQERRVGCETHHPKLCPPGLAIARPHGCLSVFIHNPDGTACTVLSEGVLRFE